MKNVAPPSRSVSRVRPASHLARGVCGTLGRLWPGRVRLVQRRDLGTSEGSGGGAAGSSGGNGTSDAASGFDSGTTGGMTGSGGAASTGGSTSSGGATGSGGSASGDGGACVVTNGGVETCDGLDNDCNGVADDGAVCGSQCIGATYGGHAYAFCSSALNFADAASACQSKSMRLTRVDDASVPLRSNGRSWTAPCSGAGRRAVHG
jgi:hypothetical protein